MKKHLVKNARIVNEGSIKEGDVLINNGIIEQIDESISLKDGETKLIDAQGSFLIPGVIDDQVHFREPGLTAKANIQTESIAAVAGGTTSYIEQPNTVPQATTLELLEEKYAIAANTSLANYSFNLGATNENLEELKRASKENIAAIKIFMGSSTGNMLVDNQHVLEKIFGEVNHQLIAHCEDEGTIVRNLEKYKVEYGDDIPMKFHPAIRSAEACFLSSNYAIELAKAKDARFHLYHISTERETHLLDNKLPLGEKKITGEACVHHLWFDDSQYEEKGTLIKWNPAVKTAEDCEGIWAALMDGRIDVVATDHAPHTLEEKQNPYTKAPSGGPLVQHSLVAMMEFVSKGKLTIEQLVEKMCHNPALLFGIKNRGFVREGYAADLVLVDPAKPWSVNTDNILYKCKWSPFEGQTFKARVTHTFVNGNLVYNQGKVIDVAKGERLLFDRNW
ncbi:MAG: dihydroorotase [Schleiferiaceae bacterium]|jgi:dihydroorotase|nr:dihydroorotase [Schleiferiaceae bacterium]